jgi:hypothetical protein
VKPEPILSGLGATGAGGQGSQWPVEPVEEQDWGCTMSAVEQIDLNFDSKRGNLNPASHEAQIHLMDLHKTVFIVQGMLIRHMK